MYAICNEINGSGIDCVTISNSSGYVANVTLLSVPYTLAVNPVTNKVYVVSLTSSNVTVINGATHAYSATVSTGTYPKAIAVNPVTNKVYVANQGSSNVTVIDGATNSTSTVSVGGSPSNIAVNPVTNKVYVVNQSSNTVTVIDGATNNTTTVPVGSSPTVMAVNDITNKIYVVNYTDNTVTVIDGATNSTITLSIASGALAIAVNPVTNKVYIANGANVQVIDGAANTTETVATGSYPYDIAVNPLTNKIYLPNNAASNVTIVDGVTLSTSKISTGSSPYAIALNPATNKIYTANELGNNVTVIDGATNTASTISSGTKPRAIIVNPATNKIYTANFGDNSVTVIDGATNTASTVSAGLQPWAIAVNPETNKIYTANYGGNSVTVIDGATNSTSTVSAGSKPEGVAVNPETNMIYVMNYGGNSVTVINGATNTTSTVSVGLSPEAIAVNSITNKVYVANYGDNSVTIIDGATNTTSTVSVGSGPADIAVNTVMNTVYVGNTGSNNVTVIDGATNGASIVSAGTNPYAIAVNPVTGKVYVANNSSSTNGLTIITRQVLQSNPLSTSITSFSNDQTTSTTPTFNFITSNTYSPSVPPVQGVYFAVDNMQSGLQTAAGAVPSFSGTTSTLSAGIHYILAFALDPDAATSINTAYAASPDIGGIDAYAFNVMPSVTAAGSNLNPAFTPGSSQPIASLSFTSISGTALITNIKIDRTGTATNSDIPTAALYIDKNKDNIVDGSDVQLGTTQTFSGTTPSVTFSNLNYYPSGSENLLAVYNIASAAVLSNTTGASMGTAYIVGQTGSTTVTFSGLNTGYNALPVELTTFKAESKMQNVELSWTTATEVNNYGFEIQRSEVSSQSSFDNSQSSFVKIGFVKGSGNSNLPKNYSFVDDNPLSGNASYRLKEIDNDGSVKYSNIVEASFMKPTVFSLSQNYPNPFNPTTTINYALPKESKVVLEVYNIMGQKTATLVNEEQQAGYYTVQFDIQQTTNNKQLSSGIYFYIITAGNFTAVKKLLLLK